MFWFILIVPENLRKWQTFLSRRKHDKSKSNFDYVKNVNVTKLMSSETQEHSLSQFLMNDKRI